jgi:hypothetical protein
MLGERGRVKKDRQRGGYPEKAGREEHCGPEVAPTHGAGLALADGADVLIDLRVECGGRSRHRTKIRPAARAEDSLERGSGYPAGVMRRLTGLRGRCEMRVSTAVEEGSVARTFLRFVSS